VKPGDAGGDVEPLPGQLLLPGMPDPGSDAATGQAALPGLDDLSDPAPGDDPELAAVAASLTGLDPDGSRMAAAIRGALDMLLDGQHTGRYRWDQLHKTEKTHAGTLVEIALARSLRLADGTALDYTIAGADVDCKFSRRMGGWMIPPEADGQLMLLVQASDEDGAWSAGLVRAVSGYLSPGGNRDGKRALNDRGRAAVCWLHHRAALAPGWLGVVPGTTLICGPSGWRARTGCSPPTATRPGRRPRSPADVLRCSDGSLRVAYAASQAAVVSLTRT